MKDIGLKQQNNQSGMVSIIVTMVMMLVISLIVIGFAQIARREQRQALDKNLSAQAFYAATSGINDAQFQILYNGYTGPKTTCANDATFTNGMSLIDVVHGVQYTCILINETPSSLIYSPVAEGQSISANMHFQDSGGAGANVDRLVINWSAPKPPTIIGANWPGFPSRSAWAGNTALLKMSLTNFVGVPAVPANLEKYDRDNLNTTTFNSFLYPRLGGAPPVGFSTLPARQGEIIRAGCIAGVSCTAQINGINSNHAWLNLTSMYETSKIVITAFDSSNQPLNIGGAQAIVDSTGRAGDVVRRIQVRMSMQGRTTAPPYALQIATGLCKDITVGPVAIANSQSNPADPACVLQLP